MRKARTERLAKVLGIFSVALGAAEIVAPRALARLLGLSRGEKLIRSFGWREVGAGLALLWGNQKAPWLWARVAGDAVDLSALRIAMRESDRKGVAWAGLASVAGITALDAYAAMRA